MRLVVIFLSIFCLPFALSAQGFSPRTGFVEGAIWFSEESLVLGESVKIYTPVFNGEDSRLTVKVDFVNNSEVFSSKEVLIYPNETKTVSSDWKVDPGSHNIFAKISEATLGEESITLENLNTESIKFSVTQASPGSVSKNPLFSKFSGVLEGEGSLMDKIDRWFKLNFTKSEEWRESSLGKLNESRDKLKVEIQSQRETESKAKVFSVLHLWILHAIIFIFSVSVVFYLLAVVVSYILLRFIWRILRRLFRKKYEE